MVEIPTSTKNLAGWQFEHYKAFIKLLFIKKTLSKNRLISEIVSAHAWYVSDCDKTEIDVSQVLLMKKKQREAGASFILFPFLFVNHVSVKYKRENHVYFEL